MDGWELVARLREMSNTPVILLTAKATEADKLRGFRLGVDDYVTKPFSFAEMAARIRAVLARAPRHLQALHGLGRCMLGAGNPERAAELLGEVLSEDEAFNDFSAALEYAEALWQAGQHEDCLRVLERMVAMTGRINHRIALAHYAMLADSPGRARTVLEQALAAHASEPETVRRRQQRWVDRATNMLASLPGA